MGLRLGVGKCFHNVFIVLRAWNCGPWVFVSKIFLGEWYVVVRWRCRAIVRRKYITRLKKGLVVFILIIYICKIQSVRYRAAHAYFYTMTAAYVEA